MKRFILLSLLFIVLIGCNINPLLIHNETKKMSIFWCYPKLTKMYYCEYGGFTLYLWETSFIRYGYKYTGNIYYYDFGNRYINYLQSGMYKIKIKVCIDKDHLYVISKAKLYKKIIPINQVNIPVEKITILQGDKI